MTRQFRFRSSLTLGLSILLTGCGDPQLNGQSARAAKGPSLVPQQRQFCQIILDGANEVGRLMDLRNDEHNPLKNEALEKQQYFAEDKLFDALYALIGPSGQFTDWRGEIGFDRPNEKGEIFAALRITNACRFPMKTLYVSLVTGKGDAIPLASPLGQTLAALDVSKEVIASGTFVYARKGGGYWSPGSPPYSDKRHFLGLENMPFPGLSNVGFSVHLTSIAPAR